ncbi:hypothetical protein Tco_1556697 [Tanacetum coccineum]
MFIWECHEEKTSGFDIILLANLFFSSRRAQSSSIAVEDQNSGVVTGISTNFISTVGSIKSCEDFFLTTRVIIKVLRFILVVLSEYPSDTYVFTMNMEILLEPTSNKLMVGDSDVHTLEDPTLILEIMSRRFFLRLNLHDHRSVLTGSGGSSKDEDGDTSFQWSQLHKIMLILDRPHESSSICFKASATLISKSS